MAEDEEKNYHVTLVEEDGQPSENEPERLDTDPLEELPKAYNPLTVLPIVAFVLLCISACEIMLVMRMIVAPSVGMKIACGGALALALCGIVILVYSVFRRLHDRKETHGAYLLCAAVMFAAILLGLIVGVLVAL